MWLASSHLRHLPLAAISLFSFFGVADVARAEYVNPEVLDACSGYEATDVNVSGTRLTAKLVLADKPCKVFGEDIETLDLAVTYETGGRHRGQPHLGLTISFRDADPSEGHRCIEQAL